MSNPAWTDQGMAPSAFGNDKAGPAGLKEQIIGLSNQAKDATRDAAGSARETAGAAVATFKDQAAQAAEEAKTTIAAVADEAKARLAQIVDDQKSAGADHVAGMARAARAAAGDLRRTSPQLAQFVDTAAERVDHMADNLRGSSIGDLLTGLSEFGRRRPIAFFGGAVAAGFLLARFVKSDAPAAPEASRDPRRV